VRVCGQEESWFATSRGTRQGDPISPTVFIADLETVMDKIKNCEERLSVHGIRINNLRFADDINIIAEDKSTLERTVHLLHKAVIRCKSRRVHTFKFWLGLVPPFFLKFLSVGNLSASLN